jgi:integrase
MGKQSKARPSPDNPRARLQAVEGQIDLLRGTVDVAEIVVEVRGELYMGPPKTRAGRRIVTLPRSVVEELAEHLGPVGEADGWVFTGDKGGVLRPSNFRVKV